MPLKNNFNILKITKTYNFIAVCGLTSEHLKFNIYYPKSSVFSCTNYGDLSSVALNTTEA